MSQTNNQLRNQNDNHQSNDQMSDPLDAVLLAEFNSDGQLQPSSGFALSVMDAIHDAATVPPPIPFPWKRILPAAIAIPCVLVAFIIWSANHSIPTTSSNYNLASLTSIDSTLCWIALACVLTLIAVLSSFRMANGRSH